MNLVRSTAASTPLPSQFQSKQILGVRGALNEPQLNVWRSAYRLMFSIMCAIFLNLETPRHGGEKNREARSVHEDVCRCQPSSAAHRGEVPRRHDQSRGVHRTQDCESTLGDICTTTCRHMVVLFTQHDCHGPCTAAQD